MLFFNMSHAATDVAVEALHATGTEGLLRSYVKGSTSEIEKHTTFLLRKLEEWKAKLNRAES